MKRKEGPMLIQSFIIYSQIKRYFYDFGVVILSIGYYGNYAIIIMAIIWRHFVY